MVGGAARAVAYQEYLRHPLLKVMHILLPEAVAGVRGKVQGAAPEEEQMVSRELMALTLAVAVALNFQAG